MRYCSMLSFLVILCGCQTSTKSNPPGQRNGSEGADNVSLAGSLFGQSWSARYGIAYVPTFAPKTLYFKFSDGLNGMRFGCDETGKQIESETIPNPQSNTPSGRIQWNVPAVVGVATKTNLQDAEASYVITVSNYKSSNPDFRVQLTVISETNVTGTVQMSDIAGTHLSGSFSVKICRPH